MNGHALAGAHAAKLRLFEIRGDPDVADLCDLDHLLAGVHVLADLHGAPGNDAGDGSGDFGVGEIEPGSRDLRSRRF